MIIVDAHGRLARVFVVRGGEEAVGRGRGRQIGRGRAGRGHVGEERRDGREREKGGKVIE